MKDAIDYAALEAPLTEGAKLAYNAMFARYQDWYDNLTLCNSRLIDSFVNTAAIDCPAVETSEEDLAVAKAKLVAYLRLHHL